MKAQNIKSSNVYETAICYELSFLMVEWHNAVEGADSSDLTRILMENGFGVVERNRGEIAGMMYSWPLTG